MGQPSPPFVQLFGHKPFHAPYRWGVWAHVPSSVNLTAYPIRFYTSSPVQSSHRSDHPPAHAPPIAVEQQPSKLSNMYSSANLRSIFEVSTSVAQTDVLMYSKNSIISLSNVPSNYITNSVAFSARSLTHDNRKTIFVCEHCKKQRHTKNQCWKLHGRPPRGNKRFFKEQQNLGRTNVRKTTSTSQPIGSTASQTSSPTLSVIAQSGFSKHFVSYTPCAGNEKIRIVDGSLAPIAGKGQIVLFDGFSLRNDLNSGRTIGTARHSKGLYILNDDTSDVSSLSCDVCIRAKQHRVSFPSQPYKPTQPFTLIHSDVWGPSKVTTSSKKRWFVTFIDDHTRLTWVYFITDKSEVHILALIRPNLPFGLRLVCLLDIPYTSAVINVFTRRLGNTVTMDVTFCENRPYFPVSHLQGESVSEESNSTFEFIEPTPKGISEKKLGPISQPSALVQDFKPPRDQGMENPIKPCTNNTMSEMRLTGHARKLDEYDPSLDIPIALRKASLDSTIIPKNIYTALKCPEWKNVVMEEMKALEKNRTWEICALDGTLDRHKYKADGTLDRHKYKADGTLDRHKARLVAKGFTQTYDIDYSETFSSVAKLKTVRVLLSVAVNKDWPLYQLDVKNAFLNGDLVEEVYMSPPLGFEAQFGQQVCKLQKSLYGLKQSPRAWFDRFTTFVKSQGYSQGHSDHTLFTKVSKIGKITILIVYVDDIVLTRDDQTEISQLKQGMLGCRPIDTPIEFNCKLENSDDQVPVDKEQYQRLAPYEKHMEAVNRIRRYLKNTPGKWLMFRKTNRKTIEAYTDSDWTGSVIDRKSTSGYCTFVWGNLVTWRSKKQSVVARSSGEAEYRAISLGIFAISIANNLVQHDRTKYVEIDRHFIKERLDNESICIPYIPSSQQVTDVLTKGLLRPHFDLGVSKLGLIDIYVPT
ncbi:Cysteine-rich RLK (receptor-like protein kinase) 8 [Cucumis melo var. makuwa]|uniref:Cysteine-rich RLK (Receptor-like protein kinase) 8 n=1 Tax=Cucumis melo var. makuwa TaxID=1194695 RepID=A0A5A7U659_CUCMM|nr:Cysteine-rich RLK (receptor-like protein kinase) 8 [Cucumis melo var. makuwa]